MPCHFYVDGKFVFDRYGEQAWWVDLEIGERCGNGSRDSSLTSLLHQLERDLFVLGSLTGELDFQVGMNRGESGVGLRQSRTHRNHGKLRTARHLNHVKITVAIAGIEGLDGYGDEEITLSLATDTLASGRTADADRLVERVKDVIADLGLIENPLLIGRKGGRRKC